MKNKKERNRLIIATVPAVLFVFIASITHLAGYFLNLNLTHYGIFPRKLSGLFGILAGPFIHGDSSHLINNAIPLLILGSALFYFYKEIASKVSFWVFLMTGIWTWVAAREAYHIGASGVLYGLFSFLLISGFIRRHTQLISLSFAVIFLYGSLVWGVFPIDVKISFESHLWGFIAGAVLAFYYKKQGPQRKEHVWDEEEDETDEANAYWKTEETVIEYEYKPTPKKESKD